MANDIKLELINNIPKIQEQINKEFEKAMLKSVIKLHGNLLSKVLVGQGKGRIYKVPSTKRSWQASAPYDPPATRLGHLRASYKYTVEGSGMTSIGFVGSELDYAPMLEKGTSRMKPRPHLSVAFNDTKTDIFRFFGGLLK